MIELEFNETGTEIPKETAVCFYDGRDGYVLYWKGDSLDCDIQDNGRYDTFMYFPENPPVPGVWVWEGYVTIVGYETSDGSDYEPEYHTEVWREPTAREWQALMAYENPLGGTNENQRDTGVV